MAEVVTAVSTAWTWFSTSKTFTAMLARFVVMTAAAHVVSRALAPRGSLSSVRATEVNVRDPAAPRQIIYGQRKVSGVLYPVGVSGTNNEYLHLLLLVAGHECEELGDVYFNDEVVPLDGSGNATGRYAGFARVRKHLGAYDQTVDTALQTDMGSGYWSNDHRLRGIAHLYIRLKVSPDLFPGGLPEFWVMAKGRKVYDAREVGHSLTDATTWEWSQTAALCRADWLRGVPTRNSAGTIVRNYGLAAADAEIEWDSVDAAANIADENVVLADATTEKRYTANGVLLSSVRSGDGIEALKSADAGDCIYIGGKWHIYAGAYRTPTVTLDESDLRAPLAGVRVKPARRELCNVVRGLYIAPENHWQPADFPPVRNATYKTQDGGEDLPLDIELLFTTSNATAQRLAKVLIERSRQAQAFTAHCKLTAFEVQAGDVVQWSHARFGWSAKPFEVLGAALVVESDANGEPYIGVDLVLKETASGVWDWADGEETEIDLAPNTTLPDPFTVATPGTPTLASGSTNAYQQPDGTTVPRLKVTWSAPADDYVTNGGYVRIEYKPTAGGTWYEWATVRGDVVEEFITDVHIGVSFDVRLRFINSNGVRGAYSATGSHTVSGDTTGPGAPSGLTATAGAGFVALAWTANTEDDFAEYNVYRHTSATFGSATRIAQVRANKFLDATGTAGTTYYYWVTAEDRSENEGSPSSSASAAPTAALNTSPPSTPSAPTYNSEGTYASGDGSIFAYVVLNTPSLPSGAVANEILYRVDGSSSWLIADQKTGSGTARIDDLSPGVAYEFGVRAISNGGALSSVSTVLDRTAPNKSAGPETPTGGGITSDGVIPKFFPGSSDFVFGARVYWNKPTAADYAYTEVKATGTNSDGATDYSWGTLAGPSDPLRTVETTVTFYNALLPAGYVRVRHVNRSGVAGSWAALGNINAYGTIGTGNISAQEADAVDITGGDLDSVTLASETVQIGDTAASSVRQIKAHYTDSAVPTLTGGAPTETFNVSLSNRGFSTKPDVGLIQCSSDANQIAAYDWDSGSNSSTNAVVRVATVDGSNLSAGASRFSVEFIEYD